MPTLVTYNLQGGGNWTNIAPAIRGGRRVDDPSNPYESTSLKADVMCLQECGRPPASAGKAIVENSDLGLSRYQPGDGEIYYLEWGEGNSRCSLAVVTRHPTTKWRVVTVGANLRPILGVKISFPGRMKGLWVYCTHMPSGNHNFASACAFDTINRKEMAGDWILAGDFNCSPYEFTHPPKGRAWKASDGVPVHSGGATHQGGNNLDFAVSPNVALTYLAKSFMSSDHLAVWFTF